MKNKFIGIHDKSFFDSSSLIHFFSGMAIGVLLISVNIKTANYFILGIICLIIWEIFEAILRRKKFNSLKSHKHLYKFVKYITAKESLLNIISDLIIGTLGLLLAYLILK